MYEDCFPLSAMELQDAQGVIARIAADGRLYAWSWRDNDYVYDKGRRQIPVDHVILRGRRYIVDKAGRVWRFLDEDSRKFADGHGGGTPLRTRCVEMWTGHWRKAKKANGEIGYAKQLILAPISVTTNAKPGISHLDYYMGTKGFKHPHEPPDAPSELDIKNMNGVAAEIAPIVWAKSRELAKADGITLAKGAVPNPGEATKRRTNKRAG